MHTFFGKVAPEEYELPLSQESVSGEITRGVDGIHLENVTSCQPLAAPLNLRADVYAAFEGLERTATPPDGKCQFHSMFNTLLEMSIELPATVTNVIQFRAFILQWMFDNQKVLEAFTDTDFVALGTPSTWI